MIWLIITIAVILLYLFALAPRLSRRDAMRAFSGTMFATRAITARSEAYRKIL